MRARLITCSWLIKHMGGRAALAVRVEEERQVLRPRYALRGLLFQFRCLIIVICIIKYAP